jgi:hypothetical protein
MYSDVKVQTNDQTLVAANEIIKLKAVNQG